MPLCNDISAGFMSKMFGIGGKKAAADNAVDDDAFKDFAFAKEDMELKEEPTAAPAAVAAAEHASGDSV
jgi:hypothetical protein